VVVVVVVIMMMMMMMKCDTEPFQFCEFSSGKATPVNIAR
jgi:hypothetical protein